MSDIYSPYNPVTTGGQYMNYFQRPTYPQYIQQAVPQQPQNNQNTFQWVQGQAAAEAYLVAPGNSVILMDSNAPVIYFKSADANGRYLPMKTYDLVERTNSDPGQGKAIDTSSFVKRDEIEKLVVAEVDKYLSSPVN